MLSDWRRVPLHVPRSEWALSDYLHLFQPPERSEKNTGFVIDTDIYQSSVHFHFCNYVVTILTELHKDFVSLWNNPQMYLLIYTQSTFC